jgi:hypothetical protein
MKSIAGAPSVGEYHGLDSALSNFIPGLFAG